jgi:hypothetical protein
MRTRGTRGLPAGLEGLHRRLECWRRTRKGHARIPEALWASAVKAVGRYGLNPTARALGLDYYSLKKRVEFAACGRASGREGVTSFVELAAVPPAGCPECILELEEPGGAKMRVQLKGVEAPDLAALSRSFWGDGQ